MCDVSIMFYFPSLHHAAYIVHYLVSKASDKGTPCFAHDLVILDVFSLILLFAEWYDHFKSFFFTDYGTYRYTDNMAFKIKNRS